MSGRRGDIGGTRGQRRRRRRWSEKPLCWVSEIAKNLLPWLNVRMCSGWWCACNFWCGAMYCVVYAYWNWMRCGYLLCFCFFLTLNGANRWRARMPLCAGYPAKWFNNACNCSSEAWISNWPIQSTGLADLVQINSVIAHDSWYLFLQKLVYSFDQLNYWKLSSNLNLLPQHKIFRFPEPACLDLDHNIRSDVHDLTFPIIFLLTTTFACVQFLCVFRQFG